MKDDVKSVACTTPTTIASTAGALMMESANDSTPTIPEFTEKDFEVPFEAYKWLDEQRKKYGSAMEASLMGQIAAVARIYGITNFKSIYGGIKKDREAEQKAAAAKQSKDSSGGNTTNFTGSPIPGGLCCGPFVADDNGIRVQNERGVVEII